MKLKPKLKYLILIILNIVVIISVCIMNVIGNSMAVSQEYNFNAERWKNNSKENFAQISTFLSQESEFNIDDVNSLHGEFIKSLNDASIKTDEKNLPFSDAYSSQMGTFTVRGDLIGRSDAVLTAVGGDFFSFRNFQLVSGAFFTDKDIMHDGAVIDRSLAWALYGSYDVAGMNLYINGVKFYISGVIENPSTEPEKTCIGKLPRIYISYAGTAGLLTGDMNISYDEIIPSDVSGYEKITCYEVVLLNPVENFAYNIVKTYFSQGYNDKYSMVKNSTRFDSSVRAKAFKKISDYAIIKNDIIFPYWENASRLVEFKLTFLYFFRNILFIVPSLTILWLVIISVKFVKKKKPLVLRKISILIDRKRIDIKEKLKNRQKKET